MDRRDAANAENGLRELPITRRPPGQVLKSAALDAAIGALQWGALTVGRAGPLRRAIVSAYDRRILAGYAREMEAVPNPLMIEQKRDIALAILHTMDRAMEYGLLGSATMRGVLNIIAREILFPSYGQEVRQAFQARHGAIPPGLLAISPIKACNLRCKGCFTDSGPAGRGEALGPMSSSSRGKARPNASPLLEWDIFARIVRDARELWGAHFFILAGGEPFLYKDQGHRMIDIAEAHRDCFFLLFTNATLIDDDVARRLGQLGNVTPAVSVEGLRETTDDRRGKGIFDRVVESMGRLRRVHVPFGLSITATSKNYQEIMSDEFIDFFYDQMHAMYGWIFQYMPIGRAISIEMMPTPEQRLWMLNRMWQIVAEKHHFLADFWSSGILTDGCLAAGGRGGYMYIDWNGAITPCAFVPYSPVNIHDVYAQGKTLNDVWAEPFFADLRRWQQEYNPGMGAPGPHPNGNLLTPCPYRDHHADFLRILRQHEPEPIDENAQTALMDEEYHAGMVEFDHRLSGLLDPIWQRDYLPPWEP